MKGYKMKDKYLEGLIATNAFVAGAEGRGPWGDISAVNDDKGAVIPALYGPPVEEPAERISDPVAESIRDVRPSDPYTDDLNIAKYDIPELYHGKQTPDRIITHRTAGRGFHTPSDSRALEGGFGAHYTVDRDGKVHQIGDPTTKMWHAGPKGNTNSIGIEATGRYNEATGKWEDLTEAQERSIAQLGKNLMSEYGISSERIYPHYTLAAKSGTEGDMVMGVLRNQ